MVDVAEAAVVEVAGGGLVLAGPEDGVGEAEHDTGHDDHGDGASKRALALLALLFGRQPRLAAFLLALTFLGGHGGSG